MTMNETVDNLRLEKDAATESLKENQSELDALNKSVQEITAKLEEAALKATTSTEELAMSQQALADLQLEVKVLTAANDQLKERLSEQLSATSGESKHETTIWAFDLTDTLCSRATSRGIGCAGEAHH